MRKDYAWGFIRSMASEEYEWFNKVNFHLKGKKEKMFYANETNTGRVLIEGISWTPYGFARRVKGGFIVAKYSSYDKYCLDGTILRDVKDQKH